MPETKLKVSAKHTWSAKTIAVLVLIFASSLLISRPTMAQTSATYDDAIKQIASQLSDAIAISGKKAVAVNGFTDLDGNVTELGRFLAGDLSDSLAMQAKGFIVIDRTQPQSGAVSGASSVDALVTGGLTIFADHVRLSAKVLDAANSAILGAASVDIPRTKDVDELLARSPNSRSASTAPHSPVTPAPAASEAAAAPVTAPAQVPSHKAKEKSAQAKPAKSPTLSTAPSATGIGSVATDAYKVIATSFSRSGSSASVTLEFDAVSQNTVQLGMLPSQTYLTDESGVRWALAQTDTAKIFDVRGGFWRPVPLARGGKIQTVLTFLPLGPATGTKFTLTIAEFRPKWNRIVAIQGLQ